MVQAGFFSAIAFNAHHIQDHGMMNYTVNSCQSRHRIFEDAFPFAKDQICGNHHRFPFVALSQEREQDLHFITVVLDVADIIENHTGKLVQFREFLWQTQISLGRQKSLDKGAGGHPEHGVASLDQFIPDRSQGMTFPHARFANRDDIGGF